MTQSEELSKHLPGGAKANYKKRHSSCHYWSHYVIANDNTGVITQYTILNHTRGLLTQYRSANHTTGVLTQ